MVMVAGADLSDMRRGGGASVVGCDWRMDDLRGTEWTGEAWRHPDGTLRREKPAEVAPKFRVLDGTREDALDGLQASMHKNVEHWAQQAATFEIERNAARKQCAELCDKVADLRASRLDSLVIGFTVGMALTAGAALLVWGPF
jgi:hypothetical protein